MAVLSFESSAIKIDGFLNETEWKNTQPTVLVTDSDEANCAVDKGVVSIFCDDSTEKIHIGFKVSLSDVFDDKNDLYGVAVSVGNGDFIKATKNGISSYDTDKFSVEAKVAAYSDSAFGAEIIIGVKYGVDSVDTVRVRFIDADGLPSTVYTMEIPSDSAEESVTVQPVKDNKPADSDEKTTKLSATKKPKTTKAKTTKPEKTASADEAYINDLVTTDADTSPLMQEETTVMTVKQVELQKGFTYAAVASLIILALGICVAVNLARDKENNKK